MREYDVDRGSVLLLSETARAAAGRIAQTRGWRLSRVRDLAEAQNAAAEQKAGAVLIAGECSTLGVRPLLQTARHVAQNSPDVALGYLYGRTAAQLEYSAHKILTGNARASGKGIRLFNMLAQRHPLHAAGLRNMHAEASSRDVSDGFGAPSELDFLIGHSNGCDMGLGGVIICRRESVSAVAADELRVMPCYHGAVCSRHAAGKGIVTSADRNGARLVIAACCWGVTLAEGPFTAEFSIGESLLLHARAVSLLGVMRVANFETSELTLLYHCCASGMPIGMAAHAANRLRMASGAEPEWICFGDPAARLTPLIREEQARLVRNDGISVFVRNASATPVDVVSFIAAADMPQEPVALTADSRVLAGAISPDGMVCLTLTGSGDSAEAVIQLVDRRSFAPIAGFAEELHADAEFLNVYAAGPLKTAQPELAEALMTSVAELRTATAGWNIQSVALGSLIRWESITQEFNSITRLLNQTGERLLDLSLAFSERAGNLHSGLWAWAYAQTGQREDAGHCAHCRSAVSEHILAAKTFSGERRVGFCDACGFLYDGEPRMACGLICERVLRHGTPFPLRLDIANPYAFEVPFRIAGVFDLHETRASWVVRGEAGSLGAGERRVLEVCIDAPASAGAGVNYVGAVVVVGAKVTWFQRPVLVRGSDGEKQKAARRQPRDTR